MTNQAQSAITLNAIKFGYTHKQHWLGPIDANIVAGEFWTIVGPNGSGKTTLLKLIAGLLAPNAGSIDINGKQLSALTLRERAQTIAYLPQQPPVDIDITVRDLVLMGRFPFRSLGMFESTADHRIADEAIEMTRMNHFRDRSIRTLSGGEARRAHLAAALAQQPRFLLLDEPTAALDLHYQLAIFDILKNLVSQRNTAVISVTHDINLAMQYSSHVILLNDGQAVAAGSPADVLDESRLSAVYRVHMKTAIANDTTKRRWLVPHQIANES